MSLSQICNFYEGLNILITGGNGFIGKILVEKLLRSTDVKTIYLLMRRKKGKDVSLRLEEMLDNEPFRKLKAQRPDFKKRVKAVFGDNAYPDLGLLDDERQELIAKINVVFHVAATVRFQEDVRMAYETNVGMTAKVINLCKQLRELKAFIYVSTAYCNCYLNLIEERFYDNLEIDCKQVESMLNDTDETRKLTKKILQKWPNTYSFTKALAEVLVKDTAKDLPVGIFRPSIVISTYKEPIEGWTDSLGGPNLLVATVASGFTRFFCCNIENMVDLVPVDMCVAALIASAWDVCDNNRPEPNSIPIYNYVSSVDNPITYDEFNKLTILVHTERYPFNKCLWIPQMIITKRSPILRFVMDATLHYFPAAMVDLLSMLRLKKPTMFSKYKKFNASRYHMEYFMAHQWTFKNENIKRMWSKMNNFDRKLFPFDVSLINWIPCLRNYYKGIRHYLFKEPWHNLHIAKAKARKLKILHQVFMFAITFLGMTSLWILLLKIIPSHLTQRALIKLTHKIH